MKTEIVITNNFQKEAKKYFKKYRSLKSELENLYSRLLENPRLGTPIGNNSFKIRISVKARTEEKVQGCALLPILKLTLFWMKSPTICIFYQSTTNPILIQLAIKKSSES